MIGYVFSSWLAHVGFTRHENDIKGVYLRAFLVQLLAWYRYASHIFVLSYTHHTYPYLSSNWPADRTSFGTSLADCSPRSLCVDRATAIWRESLFRTWSPFGVWPAVRFEPPGSSRFPPANHQTQAPTCSTVAVREASSSLEVRHTEPAVCSVEYRLGEASDPCWLSHGTRVH